MLILLLLVMGLTIWVLRESIEDLREWNEILDELEKEEVEKMAKTEIELAIDLQKSLLNDYKENLELVVINNNENLKKEINKHIRLTELTISILEKNV